jgi:hypothetical protein
VAAGVKFAKDEDYHQPQDEVQNYLLMPWNASVGGLMPLARERNSAFADWSDATVELSDPLRLGLSGEAPVVSNVPGLLPVRIYVT